jgi:hypothetical protein
MRDNQPKYRQLACERRKAEREKRKRTERGAVLVSCEGKRTEPHYLRELRAALNVPAARVEIVEGQTESDAVAVVVRARQRFEQAPHFDCVFAVIDAEQGNLTEALELCDTPIQRASKKKGLAEVRVQPIISAPCFEYWLLLHFRYTDQPFARFAEVLPELLASLPDYFKADPRIFAKVGGLEGLGRALSHTAQLKRTLNATGATFPDTDLPMLVEALAELAD